MIIKPHVVISFTTADRMDAYIEITVSEEAQYEEIVERINTFCKDWLSENSKERSELEDAYKIRNTISQTAKADSGKLDLTLVPRQIIWDIAEVRRYGNEKYHSPDNWKDVEVERYRAALFRHLLAYLEDPQGKDSESGIEHYKHMACNIAFICEMEKHENTR